MVIFLTNHVIFIAGRAIKKFEPTVFLEDLID